jgi:hypothetical protein
LSFFFWPWHCLSFFFWPLHCLSFFFWSWHCLSVFELLLMITHLVSYSRFKSTLGLMLICCLCIYIPILNKIYLLTYLLTSTYNYSYS